jgi:hypothetical protein
VPYVASRLNLLIVWKIVTASRQIRILLKFNALANNLHICKKSGDIII